jgi:uncharacterized membrane protein
MTSRAILYRSLGLTAFWGVPMSWFMGWLLDRLPFRLTMFFVSFGDFWAACKVTTNRKVQI